MFCCNLIPFDEFLKKKKSLQGRLEASKESWRDEAATEKQRGAFKER